jgi:hypothetical protein
MRRTITFINRNVDAVRGAQITLRNNALRCDRLSPDAKSLVALDALRHNIYELWGPAMAAGS